MTEETEERWHGTPGGYRYHGCHCDRCRLAHARSMRDYRSRRTATGKGRWVKGMWIPREDS